MSSDRGPAYGRTLFVFLLAGGSAVVAALVGCGGGGVVTKPLPTASPAAFVLPALAAPVTIPLANPSPGQPLSATFPLGTGTAGISFPVGTTVAAGTQIMVKTVTVPSSVLEQSTGRRAAADNTAPSGTSPGLVVQVVQGAISVTNGGGSQSFATGQISYVPGVAAPPVIAPQSAGQPFTPPASFSPAGAVVPVAANGTVGKSYVTYLNSSGGVVVPVTVQVNSSGPNGAITYVFFDPGTSSPVTVFAVTSSTSERVNTSPATLTLPEIDAAFDVTVAFGATTGATSLVSATFQNALPAAATTAAARARVPQAIGGTFAVDDAVSVTPATTASFTQTPAFTFGINPPYFADPTTSYYVALFDANAPTSGLTTFAGPGTIVGSSTITFPSVSGAYTLQAGDTYTYALIQTTQTLATPVPVPVVSPTASPTPTASPAPTASPTASPTPTVATLAAPVQPSYNTLQIPALTGVLDADGGIGYNQTSSETTESMIVSASTGNFASLTTPQGQTAVVYVTVGFTAGNVLTFGSDPNYSLYVSGPAIQVGTTYSITTTLPNGSTSTQTSTAIRSDGPHSNGVDGQVSIVTTMQSFTLSPNQLFGITISH